MRDILIMAYEYKLDSILEGFEGPKYISKLDELDLEYSVSDDCNCVLQYKNKIISKCKDNPLARCSIQTEDYLWLFGVKYKLDNDIFKKEVIILFPFLREVRATDESHRSCQIYTKGTVPYEELLDIVNDLIHNFRNREREDR
jgi:hypothetical protein